MPSMVSTRRTSQAGHLAAGLDLAGAADGGLLEVFVDVHVDAAVLVLAELGLQRGDELAEGLLLVGHDVGDQQGVEQAVALGKVAADAHAAGLFAADQDLFLKHEFGRRT